jgi:hypothetical protein
MYGFDKRELGSIIRIDDVLESIGRVYGLVEYILQLVELLSSI